MLVLINKNKPLEKYVTYLIDMLFELYMCHCLLKFLMWRIAKIYSQ